MRKLFLLLFLPLVWNIQAQQPDKPGAPEIFQQIQQLNFLGSVLYVAAHPDDENTNLISYFTSDQKARTGYLSLTRGDGGQNLIGPELREQLGLIRTQELLAARRIDKGEQFFSRANDFGFSKHPRETLQLWNKEQVLGDVVWIIRQFQPDIIINRFHHESHGDTHGHHTSSAILSLEAFDLAGDPQAYPDQLAEVEVWQPTKAFFNTSTWFYGGQEAFDKADKSKYVQLDTGTFFPLLGLSNPEIAALSRSQHQSQGFGATGTRGSRIEYLELVKGVHPANATSLFEGINTTWSRVEGGQAIGKILSEVEAEFDFQNPSGSLPKLLEAYNLITKLEDDHWRDQKTKEIKEVIAASAGLFYEAITSAPTGVPGDPVNLSFEVINRSPVPITLRSIKIHPSIEAVEVNQELPYNHPWQERLSIELPESLPYTTPYWLEEPAQNGMYQVSDQNLIGLPETPPELQIDYTLEILGYQLTYTRPVTHKRNDPVKGETYIPFAVVPPVSVNFKDDVMVFSADAPRKLTVRVTPYQNPLKGKVRLVTPAGWRVAPAVQTFDMTQMSPKDFVFTIWPPEGQSQEVLKPEIELEGDPSTIYGSQTLQIDYDHIPRQTLVLPAQLKVVKLKIETRAKRVGYIHGAGDVVPEGLRQMGYQVDLLSPADINASSLSQYDAVVLGIRAYNVLPQLGTKQQELLRYVEQGGNLIVQYNTSGGLLTDQIAPYPLRLSRNRVTDETAEVRFEDPSHKVLNVPNKISGRDFENWVQERGLYFADRWGKEFTPVLSMNDPQEPAQLGSLLIASYGKGYYVYTGLSFFRQFPQGVPGAFRLFANLIEL